MEGTMTTLIHDQTHLLGLERGLERNRGYDTRIIAGFGIAMIAVAVAIYAMVVGAGVDATSLQLMSVFP
jgi:hypothetical protein